MGPGNGKINRCPKSHPTEDAMPPQPIVFGPNQPFAIRASYLM